MDDQRFSDILEEMNVLMIALEQCRYLCGTMNGKILAAGIMDFISREQEFIEEMMDGPDFTEEHMDLLLSKTADIHMDLKALDFYNGEYKYFQAQEYEAFVTEMTDPATTRYIRTIMPGHTMRVRRDSSGQIEAMYYVLEGEKDGVRDGPFILCSQGKVKEISYYNEGEPAGLWISCMKNGPNAVLSLKNEQWFRGHPKKFKHLFDSYADKFAIKKQSVDDKEEEDIAWGTVLAGSLLTVALTSLFNKKRDARTDQSQQVKESILQEA